MNLNREFKGIWIPKEIWLNKNINANCKVLLAEIDSLDTNNEQGSGCFATNKYFAEFIGVSQKSISDYINKLRMLGLIEVQSFDGRHRFIKSLLGSIEKITMQGSKNVNAASKKSNGSIENFSKSTIINNTMNNTSNNTMNKKQKRKKRVTKEVEEYVFLTEEEEKTLLETYGKDQYKKIINKLNFHKGSNGKTYKNDYMAIHNWVIDAVEAKPIQKQVVKKKKGDLIETLKEKLARGEIGQAVEYEE